MRPGDRAKQIANLPEGMLVPQLAHHAAIQIGLQVKGAVPSILKFHIDPIIGQRILVEYKISCCPQIVHTFSLRKPDISATLLENLLTPHGKPW